MIATREIEIEREKDKKRDREGRGGRTRARQRKKKLKPAAERSGRNRILRDNLIASATIEADEADEGIGYSLASTTWQTVGAESENSSRADYQLSTRRLRSQNDRFREKDI